MKNFSSFKWFWSPLALMQSLMFQMGGDPPSTTTTKTQQIYSPEEQAARDKLLAAAGSAYDKSAPKYDSIVNPASVPVGPSAATTQAQNMVSGYATGAGQTLANNAQNATNFGLSGDVLDPNKNPGFQGALNTALRKVGDTYTDAGGVLSNIRSEFTNSAPGGQSSREGIAMGLAGKSYLNTVGDVTASMTNNAYNQGLDYMKSSMALAPQSFNLGVQPGISLGAVGSQQEAYQQAQNDYNAAGTQWDLTKNWQAIAPYASFITGTSNPTAQVTGNPATGAKPSPMTGMLAGASMGASVGGPWGAAAGAVIGLLGTQ